MIVAPQPAAVEAGARVLMAGGNAVDAAVACALVQGVVSPQMCGIAGYALLTIQMAGDAEAHCIDAPALAGAGARADMWADALLRPNPDGWGYFLRGQVNSAGYTSICTPGTVLALATMLDRWGSQSWAEALAPAMEVAREGYMVGDLLAKRWRQPAPYPEACSLLELIERNAEASRIYLKKDGTPYAKGEHLRNADYADSLALLAERGADDFYHGQLAQQMAADLAANGASVTAEDFSNYRLREHTPLRGSYRGYEIAGVNAPHGGPTLTAILNILEGYDLAALGHNSPEYIYLVSMAMKAAFADRNPYMADPLFEEVPVEWMMSKERAAEWRQVIDAGQPINVAFTAHESPHTTHVTVVDAEGNCVALTHSLGSSSGVISPGMGFMYNNSMINFHPLPGHPNSIAPGKSRTTGMAPTIIYRDGTPVLVLGSPGATKIITSNLQVILNVLDFGMEIEAAVHAPRFDCQANDIRCHARIPEYVCTEVRKRHPIERIPESHGGFALVHAIAIDPATGKLSGAADAGADGMALAV
jgi:gamma-glutamyltranspeptidase/glutathione hydrolase